MGANCGIDKQNLSHLIALLKRLAACFIRLTCISVADRLVPPTCKTVGESVRTRNSTYENPKFFNQYKCPKRKRMAQNAQSGEL
jgi:hypothetical protein